MAAITWNNTGAHKEAWLNIDPDDHPDPRWNGDRWLRVENYDLPDGYLTEVMWQNDGRYDLISDQGRRFADVNGDGLSDFIVGQKVNNTAFPINKLIADLVIEWTNDSIGTSYRATYLNTGSGWQRNTTWDLPEGNHFIYNYSDNRCDLGRRLVDINADGLTDLLVALQGERFCYINTGNGFIQDDTWNIPSDVDFVYDGKDTGLRLADLNGDGAADLLIGFNDYKKCYINQLQIPDMLTGFTNGIGARLNLTYKPSTQYDNITGNDLGNLPFILWTVSEETLEDGLGNSYTTNYEYEGGYFDAGSREFRGFSHTKVIDAEGTSTMSYFKQDDIYKGRLYKKEVKDANNNLYIKTENTWQNTQPYSGVYFPYLAQSDNYTYDGTQTHTRTSYEYDSYGNVTRTHYYGDVNKTGDEKEQVIEYTYNTYDWILSTPKHTYLLDENKNKISEKWLYYDNASSIDTIPSKGLLTKEEVWLYNPLTYSESRIATTSNYDSYGNLTKITDALGRSVITTYDSQLHTYPIRVTNALGHSVSSTYDYKTGKVLSSTDANNQTTSNIYDVFGRLIKVIGPNDTTGYPGVAYGYYLNESPIRIVKAVKATSSPIEYLASYSFYDGLGRLVQTKSPAEDDPNTYQPRQIVSGTVTYDQKGQVKEKYFPYFVEGESNTYSYPDYSHPFVSFTYDAIGRVIQVTNPDTTYSTTSFDGWSVTNTDENGHWTRQIYDAYGNVVKVEESNQDDIYTTTYKYDTLGNLISTIDDQGNTTTITYDTLGRKIAMDDPDMGSWTYAYDKVGNLTSQTDAKSQTISFDYDSINRLTRKYGPDIDVTYIYDDTTKDYCIGRLSKINDTSSSTEFFYDNLGREIQSIKTVNTISYYVYRSYDDLDRLTSITYPDGEKVNYTYNKAGAIERVNGNSTYVSNVDYSATGQITHIEYGNGTYTDYTYDPNTLRLSELKTNGGSLQYLRYEFDNVGNVVSIDDYANTSSQNFEYDDLNRLTFASGTSYGSISYEYDSIGNMIQKGSSYYTYGLADGSKPHAVTNYDGIDITYDANGNMLTKGSVKFSYTSENRLKKVEGTDALNTNLDFSIDLEPGWNFVSIPVEIEDNSIPNVLSSITGSYDQVSRFNPQTNEFEHYIGDSNYDQFTTIEYTRGYQIHVTDPLGCTLNVTGDLPQTTAISLKSGWNLISNLNLESKPVGEVLRGLTLGSDYDQVKRYNKDAGSYELYPGTLTNIEKGEAFFIHCLKDTNWNLSTSTDVTEFRYDGDGGRVKMITSDGTIIYVGSLYERSNIDRTKHIFLGSQRICSVKTDNITQATNQYYYHSDHIGSSNIITDQSGNQVALYEYTPYGELATRCVDTSEKKKGHVDFFDIIWLKPKTTKPKEVQS